MLRIIYLVFMSLVMVALVVFMVLFILKGITTGYDKLMLGLYVLMLAWGLLRIWRIAKSLKDK